MNHSRMPLPIIASLVIALSIVNLGCPQQQPPTSIEVPNVVGMTEAEAEDALTGVGLKLGQVTQEHSDTVPAGRIIRQNPAAARKVSRGTEVRLVVSKGPEAAEETVSAPELSGMSVADALAALDDLGLNGAEAQEYSDTVPEGEIIRQEPAAGTELPLGSTVTIVVSRGSQPGDETVSVPDISGMSVAEALAALDDLGLNGAEAQEYSDTVPEGEIIRMEPAAGTELPLGSTVTIVVSRGSQPGESGLPVIIKHPEDITVSHGEDAGFSIEIENPLATSRRWQLSTDGGATWEDIMNRGTMVIYTVRDAKPEQDGYMYRCQLTNDAGSVTTDAATLTVLYPMISVTLDGVPVVSEEEQFLESVSASVPMTFTYEIENTGTEPLSISDAERSTHFAVLHEVVSPPEETLPPGGTTEFVVRITPTRELDWSIRWTIWSNAPGHGAFRIDKAGTTRSFEEATDAFSDPPTETASGVQWVDVTNNGYLDLFVWGGTQGPSLFFNEGGVLTEMVNTGIPSYITRVAWADFDGDGFMDFAAICKEEDRWDEEWKLRVYRNNGDGSFLPFRIWGMLRDGFLAWADFNGDGAPDLAVSGRRHHEDSQTWEPASFIVLNNGGTLQGGYIGLPVDANSMHTGESVFRPNPMILPFDFDNNGDMDMFITRVRPEGGDYYNSTRLLRNEGGGVFTAHDIAPEVGSLQHAAVWGDFNGNGSMDLAISYDTGTGGTYTNYTYIFDNEDGLFTRRETHSTLVGSGIDAHAVDFNNNGRLDMLCGGRNQQRGYRIVSPHWQRENGSFQDYYATTSVLAQGVSSVGDFNNNGSMDIATAYWTSGVFAQPFRIYRNVMGTSNEPPTAPDGLEAAVAVENESAVVTFKWNPATDDNTPADSLTYNLDVWRLDEPEISVVPPMSDRETGWRRIPAHGNAGMKTDDGAGKRTWSIRISEPGDYGWTVQAIDANFMGGPWAEPFGSFTVPE